MGEEESRPWRKRQACLNVRALALTDLPLRDGHDSEPEWCASEREFRGRTLGTPTHKNQPAKASSLLK
eukprot:1605316-Amphidinium_carterae.1